MPMDENDKMSSQAQSRGNSNDCGCEDGCCTPKKSNPFRKIIFAVILLAALGIVAFKLTRQSAPASAKESCCPPGSSSNCDTTKSGSCDTTKGVSCCPQK